MITLGVKLKIDVTSQIIFYIVTLLLNEIPNDSVSHDEDECFFFSPANKKRRRSFLAFKKKVYIQHKSVSLRI